MRASQNGVEHWLNAERVRVYPRLLLALFVAAAVAWVVLSKSMVDIRGKPLGFDFITFWAASHLALHGQAVDAYNLARIFEAEKVAVPASRGVFVWYYPPTFYLVILPLALMPYLAAYLTFMGTTLAGYLMVFRNVTKESGALWCLAAFSGLWMNLFHGQNAFLTAALAAGALLCVQRRPNLAGVLIGLLAIKPHLALLFPVALIAIRAWRTLIVAAITALSFLGLGTAVLGVATLKACVGSLGYARIFLEQGFLPWGTMPTVFASLRILGVPIRDAYAVHCLIALLAICGVWLIWRRSLDHGLRSAALMTATFLVSPYVFDYDLAWLAFPLAWMAMAGRRDGWLRGEREVLVAVWVLPLFMSPLKEVTSLQIGPLLTIALLLLILRRAGVRWPRLRRAPETARRSLTPSPQGRPMR